MAGIGIRWLTAAAAALLVACAQVPAPPTAAPAGAWPALSDTQRSQAIARHRELALQYGRAGDLPAAAAQWHVLTLLAPADDEFRRELAATRAAIGLGAKESLAAGTAALRAGDTERASQTMLRVLALDPGNAEAAKALRDLDRQKLARIQSDRAARIRQQEDANATRAPRSGSTAEGGDTYDLEQRLELLRAGDLNSGLRELRSFVDANPRDGAARQRIGAAVWDRGRELEAQGAREQALSIYEQAVALRGDAAPGWAASIQALRRALSDEYYEKGLREFRTDVALAVRDLETSVRYDPQNAKAAARLKEARAAQDKLRRIPGDAAPPR
jgi:tetratricopeptide (TPR) repeat protein